MIWNLLSNAVKFTPAGGRVEVRADRSGEQVEITVRDSGVGIEADFLAQVFDRFRQADSSSTRRFGGLGLGLSIVKQLVEMHGGTVRAESAGPGQGARFVVTLPVTAEPQPVAASLRASGHGEGALAGLRVLVVDDEPDALELTVTMLQTAGADVVQASSAEEALAVIGDDRPEVLVSDVAMPGKDGCDLLRALRELPVERGGRIPAIAVTAFARSEDRSRALMAGFQSYVAKPLDPRVLVDTIAAAAGRSATHDA